MYMDNTVYNDEKLYTLQEARKIIKNEEVRHVKSKIGYIKQKLVGLFLILLGVAALFIMPEGFAATILYVPIGVMLFFGKGKFI